MFYIVLYHYLFKLIFYVEIIHLILLLFIQEHLIIQLINLFLIIDQIQALYFPIEVNAFRLLFNYRLQKVKFFLNASLLKLIDLINI